MNNKNLKSLFTCADNDTGTFLTEKRSIVDRHLIIRNPEIHSVKILLKIKGFDVKIAKKT